MLADMLRPRPSACLWSLVSALACRGPEPAQVQASAPAPAPVKTPLTLTAQLGLAPPGSEFLAIRDLQALVDVGVPWSAFELGRLPGRNPQADDAAAFLAALRKWVDGPDPALGRSGVDLRGGLLLAGGKQQPDLLFLAGSKPDLTATLLTTLPFPGSEHTKCNGLSSVPGFMTCVMRPGAADADVPGDGATHRDTLAAALPGVDLDAATVLAHFPSKALDMAVTLGPTWQVMHFRYDTDGTTQALVSGLEPGPATLLRFVDPGAGYVWLRVDAAAMLRTEPALQGLPPPLDGLVSAWTGELLLAASTAPTALQIRAGLQGGESVARTLEALLPLAVGADPLDGLDHGKLVRAVTSVDLAGKRMPMLDLRIEDTPEVAAFATLLDLAPRAQVFVADDALAAVAGLAPDALANLVVHKDASPALAALPAEAAADLRAGRATFLAVADLDALHSPAMAAGLVLAAPHVNADALAEVRENLRTLAVVSRVVLWGTEVDGALVSHLAIALIGNTRDDEGRAALAALTAPETEGGPLRAFTALANAHPDSPHQQNYRRRSDAASPAALTHSLVGIAVLLDLIANNEDP